MLDICGIRDSIKSCIDGAHGKHLTNSLCCGRRKPHFSNQEDRNDIWSKLPKDMLDEIISSLDSPKDYMNSIGVCRRWRSIGRDLKSKPTSHLLFFHPLQRRYPFPMLLQPNKKNSNLHYFYSVTKRKVKKFYVSEIRNKWIAGSWRGWLAVLDMREINEVHLLNPVSKVKISLPPFSIYSEQGDLHGYTRITRSPDVEKIIIVSYEETFKQSSCTIFALERSRSSLQICKIADDKWERIIIPKVDGIGDIIKFRGTVYFVGYFGTLFAIETNPVIKVTPIIADYRNISYADRYYLAESSGDLLLITRRYSDLLLCGHMKTILFKVYILQEEHE